MSNQIISTNLRGDVGDTSHNIFKLRQTFEQKDLKVQKVITPVVSDVNKKANVISSENVASGNNDLRTSMEETSVKVGYIPIAIKIFNESGNYFAVVVSNNSKKGMKKIAGGITNNDIIGVVGKLSKSQHR